MNIYEKLIEVRKEVPYLQKENAGQQYKYVSSSQVLANCKKKMDELGVLLVPRVTGHKVSESVIEQHDKDGHVFKRTTTYFTELDMTMTWLNAEKPEETIECPWYGQGVDIAGEKGVGKAMTYAEKYFMLKFFNIATDKDDPDSFQEKTDNSQKPKTPPAQAEKKSATPQGKTAPPQKSAAPSKAEAPVEGVRWADFWLLCKDMGYTEAQVHKIAGVDSLKGWTKVQTTELYRKLQTMKAKEDKRGA